MPKRACQRVVVQGELTCRKHPRGAQALGPWRRRVGKTSYVTTRSLHDKRGDGQTDRPMPAPACTAPALFDEAALTSGTRHTCAVLHHACLFNATIVPFGGSATEEQQAAAAAQRIMVRNIFNSHSAPFPLQQLHSMRPAIAKS